MTSETIASVAADRPTTRPRGALPIVGYADWLKDFERRLALHDEAVAVLARDLAVRTGWRVEADAPGFPSPQPRAGRPPDVVCERGPERPPIVFEVELPETLVRRDTVRRLSTLLRGAMDTRVVLIVDGDAHDTAIKDATRLLHCAGLEIPIAAVAPRTETFTGASW